MRNAVIGIVIGIVVGVVIGAMVIAPQLPPAPGSGTLAKEARPEPVRRPMVRWKMASAFGGSLPQLGTLAKRVDSEIWGVSGGEVEIKFHEPGTLLPAHLMFDAVSKGTLDAAFSSPSYWADKAPSLLLFAAVPFGPTASEYLGWIYFGGGLDLLEEIYHRFNIHSVPCGMIAPEASGWFRKEIHTLGDLKGLTMGIRGLGSKVMEKLDVTTLALADADIFMALEAGTINATEYSMPAIDLRMGFHQMAKHYYFPGWHQPATMFDLMINRDKWESLTDTQKAQIKSVCGDNMRHGLAEGEASQFEALKELNAKGVHIHRWPATILEALERAWQDVVDEEAVSDTDFARVWKSLTAYRKKYAIWKELAYP